MQQNVFCDLTFSPCRFVAPTNFTDKLKKAKSDIGSAVKKTGAHRRDFFRVFFVRRVVAPHESIP